MKQSPLTAPFVILIYKDYGYRFPLAVLAVGCAGLASPGLECWQGAAGTAPATGLCFWGFCSGALSACLVFATEGRVLLRRSPEHQGREMLAGSAFQSGREENIADWGSPLATAVLTRCEQSRGVC